MRRLPQHAWHVPLLGLVLFASGCSAPVEVIDYQCGQAPQVATALRADVYTLMDKDDHRRIEATTCNFADSIGFVRQNGNLEAVAGDERIPLSDGNYSWVIEQPRFGGIHPSMNHPQLARGRGALGSLMGVAAGIAAITAVNAVAGGQ